MRRGLPILVAAPWLLGAGASFDDDVRAICTSPRPEGVAPQRGSEPLGPWLDTPVRSPAGRVLLERLRGGGSVEELRVAAAKVGLAGCPLLEPPPPPLIGACHQPERGRCIEERAPARATAARLACVGAGRWDETPCPTEGVVARCELGGGATRWSHTASAEGIEASRKRCEGAGGVFTVTGD